jgi:ABC-type multidrug transport system ATPase subunit
MEGHGRTAFFRAEGAALSASGYLTISDGTEGGSPIVVNLSAFGKNVITFGRDENCDIVLRSSYASRRHGQITRLNEGVYRIEDTGSTNGLLFGGKRILSRVLQEGDIIRIDKPSDHLPKGIMMAFSQTGGDETWRSFPVTTDEITIGRGENCDIRLDHISVSRLHAVIARRGDKFYITDSHSANGIFVNGRKISGHHELREKDLIVITNSKLIFSSTQISYLCFKDGIGIDASGIVKMVGKKNKIICSNVDLTINPCEIVAIIGGSGAGKSTVMNCISGYSRPTEGTVSVSGIDLYENYNTLKTIIGYVPQADIVYENLTVFDMLKYAAKLRLPMDVSKEELYGCIKKAIDSVELANHENTMIKNLSGGQRKRASIAVELLSDPNLFFLDEPASGLDPGTERNLMATLRKMTHSGKTVVFVTHSTLNLHMCDKIVFMGAGGHLCFCGSYDEALKFFGVTDMVDVYDKITFEAEKWKGAYNASLKAKNRRPASSRALGEPSGQNFFFQTAVLLKRHLHILLNDKSKTLLILMQAPLLAILISVVANGEQYEEYGITKSLLFALSCSAFWVGTLNAIQEVCKERNIFKREYMTGLGVGTYITSKMLAIGLVCAVQAIALSAAFALTVGLPSYGVIWDGAFLEVLITTFLVLLAASAMGIFVSSMFKTPDGAMTVAPLLLMPQLLFSGLIFELDNITEAISYLVVCRWAMEGYGTTADLNELIPLIPNPVTYEMEPMHPPEDFFEFTASHMGATWVILCVFIAAFSVMAGVVLSRIKKEREK